MYFQLLDYIQNPRDTTSKGRSLHFRERTEKSWTGEKKTKLRYLKALCTFTALMQDAFLLNPRDKKNMKTLSADVPVKAGQHR